MDRTTQHNTKSNVSLGKPISTGCVWWAPTGTPLPTDANTPLDDAFVCVGYISEDGITNAVDTGTTDVNDMGGVKVLSEISSYGETYQFSMLELNEHSAKLRYGAGNVTVDDEGGFVINHSMPTGESIVMVLEILMTGQRVKRIVIADATVNAYGDTSYSAGDAIMYDVTMAANPSELLDGASSREYIAKIANPIAVETVTLSKTASDGEAGTTDTVDVSYEPADATDALVKAVSDNETIASVSVKDKTLTITRKAEGKATITVTVGGKTAQITVTVTAKAGA